MHIRQDETRDKTRQGRQHARQHSRVGSGLEHTEREEKEGKEKSQFENFAFIYILFFLDFFCQRDGGVKILVRQPGPCFWLVKKNERRTGRKKIGSSFAGQIIET